MAILGIIFLVIIGLLVLVGLWMLLMSIPDLNRYLRVRRM